MTDLYDRMDYLISNGYIGAIERRIIAKLDDEELEAFIRIIGLTVI